jgi:hypothetical protein
MNMRKIKLLFLAVLATCALAAIPAVSSAAGGPDPVVTANGIKVNPCKGQDFASLAIFVRGVGCGRALDLANEASSGDDPCPIGWHTRHVRLKAGYRGEAITGPSAFLCTQRSGTRAFTYSPFVG